MKNETKQDLKSRINFLENVLDSLPMGIIVLDEKGTIVRFNRSQEKISRIGREKVLGHLFHEKFNKTVSDWLGTPHYQSLVREKKPFEMMVSDITPQYYDEKVTGLGAGAPIQNDEGSVLVFYLNDEMRDDKHSLKLLAKNLHESRAFLQNLIDSHPSAIFTVSDDGIIQTANQTANQIFDYCLGDFTLKPVLMLFWEEVKLEELLESSSINSGIEIMCLRKSGEPFSARLQISDIQKVEGVKEQLIIITDISREKTLEEKLAISEKLALYTELIAGIFHQINNPLVGVVNFSSLLLEQMNENDKNRFMVETIHKASQKCQTLITSMVKGFREPQSTFSKVFLQEALEHAIEEMFKRHPEKADQVSVITNIDIDIPYIMGDLLQLSQVFSNLLDNAFQAMPSGGVIEIGAHADFLTNESIVGISDTGCGIKIENINKIFTPFFSTKRDTGGGLGLSFAYQIIKNHSGRIEVETREGAGSTFRVVLPFAEYA